MPSQASHSLLIELPIEQVWSKLRDLTLAPHYVPGLTACQLHPGPQEGLGTSRRVLQKNGQWLDESVVEWQHGSGFVLCLHQAERGAPFPFRQASFRYALQAEASGTRLTTSLIYQPAGGVFGRLLDHLLLRRALNKVVAQIAENLKAFYESGQTQNESFKLRDTSTKSETPIP